MSSSFEYQLTATISQFLRQFYTKKRPIIHKILHKLQFIEQSELIYHYISPSFFSGHEPDALNW